MPLHIELKLEERHDDAVLVTVRVAPHQAQRVDGVAVELHDASGEAVSPRVLLPISGHLSEDVTTRAELRVQGTLPPDARVVATAWWGGDQVQTHCPCEWGSSLERFVLGEGLVRPGSRSELRELEPEERAAFGAMLPWLLGDPDRPPATLPVEAAPVPREDLPEEVVSSLGLDEESAAWLKELLEEPD